MRKLALLSVSDKTGLVPFAKTLAELGYTILSTGGTAKTLKESDIPITDVSEYTQSPEVMDGRVKTLHPKIHGGLLMRDQESDRKELQSLGGEPIDVVVVNLYPFSQKLAEGAPFDVMIENIDIGGPSMLRSAAKNHARVTVLVDPNDYERVALALKQGGTSSALRFGLAAKVFAHTAMYDGAISNYLNSLTPYSEEANPIGSAKKKLEFPKTLHLSFEEAYPLRYGENPHQHATFYKEMGASQLPSMANALSLGTGAKELSYNNLVDADAAWECVLEFSEPTAVIIKHANPCGVASSTAIEHAYETAFTADPLSAFGGIVALNRPLNKATAEQMITTFLECVIAPSIDKDALELLHTKKNLRILSMGDTRAKNEWMLKRVSGGLLVQGKDLSSEQLDQMRVVTTKAPSAAERDALAFAWKVCKHVKSNAIVLSKDTHTVGIGAGQMSRVISVEIAAKKAGDNAQGSVLASDAFFPFPDGVEQAAAAGATAIIQPGGSVKDDEVISTANKLGLSMIFTGFRHFRH